MRLRQPGGSGPRIYIHQEKGSPVQSQSHIMTDSQLISMSWCLCNDHHRETPFYKTVYTYKSLGRTIMNLHFNFSTDEIILWHAGLLIIYRHYSFSEVKQMK
jgi:hypothetical protein